MKIKKISTKMKLFIAAMVMALLSVTAIGVSQIFAEPTINDLVETPEIGTFEPSKPFDELNDKYKLVAWLNTTHIFVDYDKWIDTSNNGMIEVEDVYSTEGFESHVLISEPIYPILEIEGENNFFIIAFPDYARYDGVVAQLQISGNNYNGKTFDQSKYWFDHENNYLYIDKEIIMDSLGKEEVNSIRSETVMLVKSIQDLTKEIEIITLGGKDVGDEHEIVQSMPNETREIEFYKWLTSGLTYQLVPYNKLAYISAENLTVYVNAAETDAWSYDETNGFITIDCEPYKTVAVAVEINAINEVNVMANALQFLQASKDEATGEATTLQQALTGDTLFLDGIDYGESKPSVGYTQALGWTIYAHVNDATGACTTKEDTYAFTETFPSAQTITQVFAERVQPIWAGTAKVNGHFISTAVHSWDTRYTATSETTAEAVRYLTHNRKNGTNLSSAISVIESSLLSSITDDVYQGGALCRSWKDVSTTNPYENGIYVTGTLSNNLLGGSLTGGYAMFDVRCADISTAATWWSEGFDDQTEINTFWHTDYRAYATILRADDYGNGSGYLYVAIWSKTIGDYGYAINNGTTGSWHGQRFLSFHRIPYTYDEPTGKFSLMKTDADSGDVVPGAVYGIFKDAACTQYVESITTANTAVLSVDLDTGTYYIKETTSPSGYKLDTEAHKVVIAGGQTTPIYVTDEKEACEVTLEVYDADTEGDNIPDVAIPGLTFTLYDPEGVVVGTYTTDENGKIQVTIPSTGIYHFEQDNVVDGYCMTHNESDVNHHCDYIRVDARAGQDSTEKIVHYEKRQNVTIQSQVQDVTLGDKSPDELGGDAFAQTYTTLVGAKYKFKVKDDATVFLGYYNGTKINLTSTSQFNISDKDVEFVANTGYVPVSGAVYSDTITSKSINEKAYVEARSVQVQYDGQTLYFPLRTGDYYWELDVVSSGYWDNAQQTAISVPWTEAKAKTGGVITKNDVPVKQTRQTVELELFVKSYKDNGRHEIYNASMSKPNTIANNELTGVKPIYVVGVGKSPYTQYIDNAFTKNITSTGTTVNTSTQETAVLFKNGSAQYAIETSDVAPNAIYALVALSEIVGVNTGEEIKAGTTLGFYLSDPNGQIVATKVGTAAFTNPNEESKQSIATVPAVNVVTVKGKQETGLLPNGVYAWVMQFAPDEHKVEIGLVDDVVTEVTWKEEKQETQLVDASSATMFYHSKNEDDRFKVPVAPNPDPDADDSPNASDPDNPNDPNNPYSPYDPLRPEDPSDPDDSKDIPLVTPEWIDSHQYNAAYRVIDLGNYELDENGNPIYDVKDRMPTTFAFYVKKLLMTEEIYHYNYRVSFYYEVPKAEYDAATQAQIDSYEYDTNDNGLYFRRLSIGSLSGGESLQNIITLNETSDGFVNFTSASEDGSISGSIHNTEWLNEKMKQAENGKYHIAVRVDVTMSYNSKATGEPIEVEVGQPLMGILEIRNRHLFELD